MMNIEWSLFFSAPAFLIAGLGLLLGSLANVFIYRVPRELPLGAFSGHRSRCTHCEHKIAIWDNVPVFSYFLLRGKCRTCQKRISWRYPLVEFLTGVVFWVSFSLLIQERVVIESDPIYWLWICVELYFLWSLIVVFFVDVDFRIIPDRFSLGNWIVAIGAALLFPNYFLFDSILGGLFGFGIFFLLAWGYEKYKGIEGLGFGDVKMMGWLGTWLGMSQVSLVILLGSILGLIVGLWAMRRGSEGMRTAIPFGPFLAVGAYVVWLKLRYEGIIAY